MDYNKVAQKIIEIGLIYDSYEETVRRINYNYALLNGSSKTPAKQIKFEELDFDSFDEDDLEDLSAYFSNLQQQVIHENYRAYYDVNSDDYK